MSGTVTINDSDGGRRPVAYDEQYAGMEHLRNVLDKILDSSALFAPVRRDAQQIESLTAAHRLLGLSGSRSR